MKDETVHQHGVAEGEGILYTVERDFWMAVVDGPPQVVRKGQRVLLDKRLGMELFGARKVAPADVGTTFKAVRSFRTVQEGKWLEIKPGDVLKLGREEAIQFLREGKVIETKGGAK